MFEINGLDTLSKKLEVLANNYPKQSDELLVKMGNKFRNHVKQLTPDSGNANSKRKLMKSYRVSKVQGYGSDRFVEFRSTAPHFHLIERGHDVVAPNSQPKNKKRRRVSTANRKKYEKGKSRVEGRYMVKKTTIQFQKEFPSDVEKMVNKMIRNI